MNRGDGGVFETVFAPDCRMKRASGMKGLAGMERETETEGKEKNKDTPTAIDKSWSMKKGGGWVLRTCSGNS